MAGVDDDAGGEGGVDSGGCANLGAVDAHMRQRCHRSHGDGRRNAGAG